MYLKSIANLKGCIYFQLVTFHFFYLSKSSFIYYKNYNLAIKKKYCSKNMRQKLEQKENLSPNQFFYIKIKNIELILIFINFRKRKKSTSRYKNFEKKNFPFYIKGFSYYTSLIQYIYSKKKRTVRFIYLKIKNFLFFTSFNSFVNSYLLEGKFLLKIKFLKAFLIFKIENVIKKKSKKYIIFQNNFKKTSDSKIFILNNTRTLQSSFLVMKQIYPSKFFLWKTKFFGQTIVVPNSYVLLKKNSSFFKNINMFYKKILFVNQKGRNFFWRLQYFLYIFFGKRLKNEFYIQFRIRKNWLLSFILYEINSSYFKKSISKNFEVQLEILRICLLNGKINRKKIFKFINYHVLVLENLEKPYLPERNLFFVKQKSFFFLIDIILFKTVKIKSILLFQKIPKIFFLSIKKKKTVNVKFFSLFNFDFFKNNFNHIELENFIYFSNHVSRIKGLPKFLEKILFSCEEKFIFKILQWNSCDGFNSKLKKLRCRINLKIFFEIFLISTNFVKIGLENFFRIYCFKSHLLNMQKILFFSILFGKMIYKSGYIGKARFFFLNGFFLEKMKNENEKIFGFWFFIEYINGSISILEKLFKLNFIFQSITKTYFKKFFFI